MFELYFLGQHYLLL